jgi:YVTN family beta-propeller protein
MANNTGKWVRLLLVALLLGVIIMGYGGLCRKSKSDNDVIVYSSASVGTIIMGEVFEQTSDSTMVPSGGATVTATWSDGTAGQLIAGQNAGGGNKSASTKTNSDGSYSISGIPPNTPVTITITSADTTQSVQTLTTSESRNNSSAILKGKGKKIGLIKNNQESTLNTFDDATLPRCQITIPANAISTTVDNVYLTPTHNGENLAQLPDGYVFLAGAEFKCSSEINFASGKESTPYIILPSSVKAEDLTGVDIKLMEFINGNWVINNGKGKVFTIGQWAGHIGSHDSETPAKLKGVHTWCWVGVQPTAAQINGIVRNASGSPIKGALVFGGGVKTNSKSDGSYTLRNISLLKPNTLIPVNVTADNYQMSYQFVSISPGATVNNVNFSLDPVSQLGEVYGKVTDATDDSVIYGAIVTLQTNPTIRGMKYDDKNTSTDLTDDTFYVIPPPGVTITNYKWMLSLPDGQKFTSAIENGQAIVLNQFATEATNAGYSLTIGAYKAELEVTYQGGKKVTVSGGFLIKQSGFISYIADVKLPVSIQDQLFLKTVTDASGNYRFINLPTGETLYAQAKAMGFIASNSIEITALTPAQKKEQNFSLADVGTDTEPPSPPSNFTGTAQTTFSILLTWSPSTDTNGIDYYRVYRGIVGVPGVVEIGKTTNTSYLDAGLSPETDYKYQIGAVDRANWATNSDMIYISTPADIIDNTSPTTPTNLAATVMGPTQINLSWWASTDDVGVLGYEVYRDGALFSTLNALLYANNELSANTTYEYKVRAYDASGKYSPYSNIITATTASGADIIAPSVPTNLSAVALSSGSIALSWTASTDNVGVTGYKVYRSTDGISYTLRTTIGVTTNLEDSGLSASTIYYYKVSAVDGAGNTSAQSNSANATTQAAGGGGQLVAYWKFDEGSGTSVPDSSGNGNNGTVYGATWSGGALSFDGVDDYVAVPHSSSFNTGSAISAEFWVNRRGTGDIITKGANDAINIYIDVNGKLWAVFNFNSSWKSSATLLETNKWYHIAVTCGGSQLKIFINGVQDSIFAEGQPLATNSEPLLIGKASRGSVITYFNGYLDDVKIYNYARSAGDIQADYDYAVTPYNYVWVTNQSSNNVTRIRKSDSSKTTIAVGTHPWGVAVDSNYVWVSNRESSNVTRIKTSDLTTTLIAAGSYPGGIAVDETYCWVVNGGSNNVTRILKSDLTTSTIAVGSYPIGVAVDATYVWVTNGFSNNVTRIKKSDLSTTTIGVGTYPYGVAVDATYCWVANESSNNCTRIKKSDLTTTTIAVGSYPEGVAVDATYVWVTIRGSNNVTQILKSDSTTTTIPVGTGPYGVAVDETYCWVTNQSSNNVTRILKSDIIQKTTIAVGSLPFSLGDMTGYAYDNYSNQ